VKTKNEEEKSRIHQEEERKIALKHPIKMKKNGIICSIVLRTIKSTSKSIMKHVMRFKIASFITTRIKFLQNRNFITKLKQNLQ
jgi:hypothetical protein